MDTTRVESVEVRILEVPLNRAFWMSQQAYMTAGQVTVSITTTDGLVGFGQAHGNPMDEIAGHVRDRLAPAVIGRSPWEVRSLWQEMFSFSNAGREEVTTGQPHFGTRGRYQLLAAIAAMDIALWDLRAQCAEQPLWRFLGASDARIPAYATGGYYPNGDGDDPGIDELLSEVASYVELGMRAVKIKVGRDPAIDIQRVTALREAYPDLRIKVDANGGWTLAETLQIAPALRDLEVFWLEEPLQWHYGPAHHRRVRQEGGIPLAAGEQEMHQWGAMELVDTGDVSYLQTDATRAGGLTAWMDAANYAHMRGVGVAPHHDGHIHGHYLATLSGEKYCETFPNAERDPLWFGLYTDKPTLADGYLTLSDKPGLGIELDRERLEAWTVMSHLVTRS